MSSTADRKTVVIDTSAFIAGGKQALFAYEGQEVVIPQIVLRELDKLRNDVERGYNARVALRALETMRFGKDGGEERLLNEPVKLDNHGGTIRVELNHIDETDLPASMKKRNGRDADYDNDIRILAVAKNLLSEGKKVTLVTNDLSLRVNASSIGIGAQELPNSTPDHGGEFTGIEEHYATPSDIGALYSHGEAKVKLEIEDDSFFGVNYGVKLNSGEGSSALAVVKEFNKDTGEALLNPVKNREAWGMVPRSAEQRVALNHLMNRDIEIVSLGGRAGTGKTALAIAAALEQIMEQPDSPYKKIMVFRSPHAVGGQEMGYLPGEASDKMAPWASAVFDALESFTSDEVRKEIAERGLVEVLPMTHIRGRSLNEAFVIIDEAQNLEFSTLMTGISRIGKDSKIVMTWDITQRDNLRVGRHNGIAAAVNEMAGEDIFSHTTLTRTERSRVAELASKVLEKVQG